MNRWLLYAGTVLLVVAAGCSRKPAPMPVPVPPAPTAIELGDQSLRDGLYDRAVQHYQRYLVERPGAPDRDVALFREALASALSGPAGLQPARTLFDQLITLFPRSFYTVEARLILQLLQDLDKTSVKLSETSVKLSETSAKLSETSVKLSETSVRLGEKETQLKKVAGELDRLKKIDMERRPVRPPK